MIYLALTNKKMCVEGNQNNKNMRRVKISGLNDEFYLLISSKENKSKKTKSRLTKRRENNLCIFTACPDNVT